MKVLTEKQVNDYRRNGFLFPIPVLTPSGAAEALHNLGRLETHAGAPLPKADKRYRVGTYTFLPWVDALVRHPRILDAVEDVIGPDILVFWATFFIKEPGSPTFAAWHQDATYFGLTPHEHLTAWVALSDASKEAGCMDVLPPDGEPTLYGHARAGLENSINGAGQTILQPLDESRMATMELKAGEMSMHNTLCPHRSRPNSTSFRRVGFGISYIPAHTRNTGSRRMYGLLVRGRDHGNFDLLPAPRSEYDPEAMNVNERVYERFYENFVEQAQRHEEHFGVAPA